MKLNPRLFEAIGQITARARRRTEVRFLSLGASGLAYAALSHAVRAQISNAIVFREASHEIYQERLGHCDLFLSPFPYGNVNSILDCYRAGLPGVCLDGAEAHAHADAAFLARIGLPDALIATSVEGYINAAVKLIDDDAWREDCRTIVAGADLDAAFFQGDPDLFAQAIVELIAQAGA